MASNYAIRNQDCSGKDVVLVRGSQAEHLRTNPTAHHLKAEFVLPGMVDAGDDDLHIFSVGDEKAMRSIAVIVERMGGDFSQAVVMTLPH